MEKVDVKILASKELQNLKDAIKLGERDGIPIEKGVTLTETHLEAIQELLERYIQFFTAYPDIFVDLVLTPSDSNFSLFFFQRIFLRACMRYRYVYNTAPRAFSKTFISLLALILGCIFRPGAKIFMVSPTKEQAAKVCAQKVKEILELFPLLRKELVGEDGNFGKDYVKLTFRNGSILDVVGALESSRGIRRHAGLIDEVRDHDGTILNEVVLPTMNVSRRTAKGVVNPYEPNQQSLWMTSAGMKSSYAYEKAIEIFEMSIIQPKTAFYMSCDYRVPMMHGLVDKQYIRELKLSPTFEEESFAREYLGIWSGGSDESWFKFDKLQNYRRIKNPEMHEIQREGSDQFYLLSVDVGRLNDQTVVCVFRVNIIKGKFYSTLVNIVVLGRQAETKTFHQQAIDLKQMIKDYNPKEVVIDTNGLGIGLGDEMIRSQIDARGQMYPAYGFINDDNYKKVQPKDAIKILYGIKANGPLNSKIHGNCFSRISSGMVHFLIKEQEAKNSLMSTKIGQKMTTEQRVKRLMPHEMTTKLFEEMANLRLKRTGATLDIILEQINSRFPKDKYSAFAYGQWRIKELEEENYQKKRRHGAGQRKLTFFSGGN
jgi:hypothetical protein